MSWWIGLTSLMAEHLYINYGDKPDPVDLLTYPTCILDPHAEVDLRSGQKRGHRFYAYLSLVELAAGSPADDLAKKRYIPVLGQNTDWGSHLLDIRTEAWASYLLEDIATPAVTKGYNGFFLDTADSIAKLPPEQAGVYQKRLVTFIQSLHQRWPKLPIIINRGFELLPELKGVVTAVLIESVFESVDAKTQQPVSRTVADVEWITQHIKTAQALGLKVYAVDYTTVERLDLARSAVKKLRELGCVPLVTTLDLRGTVIAPKLAPPKE
jgi:polysaccharide biosynthesis protein PelA